MDYYAYDSLGPWTVNNDLHRPVRQRRPHTKVNSGSEGKEAGKSTAVSANEVCFSVNANEVCFNVSANEVCFSVSANEVCFSVSANEVCFNVSANEVCFSVRVNEVAFECNS